MNFILAISLLLTLASTFPVTKRDDKTVAFTFKKVSTKESSQELSIKAASNIDVSLTSTGVAYIADIELGTPGQSLTVIIDTGSSDLWVPGAGTSSTGGTYDSSSSSSFNDTGKTFQIQYADGTTAQGSWVTDTLSIGGAKVEELEFGDATENTAGTGVLGVGLKSNEASNIPAYSDNPFTYNNLPYQLKSKGLISVNGYSLSLDSSGGQIVFGPLSGSYSADLVTLPLSTGDGTQNTASNPSNFFVDLKSVKGKSTFSTSTAPALLDSGTTLIYAPNSVADAIGSAYGQYSFVVGGYVTDCSATGEDLTFGFEGISINVPSKDTLYELGDGICLVGVLSSGTDYWILGDTFLRHAFVYYNLDDATISLAKSN